MLQAAVNAGFVWLAVVGVLAALIGAFYYLRIVKLMYFDDPSNAPRSRPAATRGACSRPTVSRCSSFGILPQPLMGLCAVALRQSQYLLTASARVRTRAAERCATRG